MTSSSRREGQGMEWGRSAVVALLVLCAPWAARGDDGASTAAAAVDAGIAEAPAALSSDAGTVTSPAQPSQAIEALDLEALLDLPTVSSTKTVQRAAQAPAVMTVVTAEELMSRGYTSVADALRVVPGFYDVYDLATHNVGVRGINGGARSSGSVIKLMIDGQPVDFRPTTGNFFGEELIPLVAVERIEIIRGPASALYGANAFLGVVNVITKKGADAAGVRLVGHGALSQGRPGGGGGLLVGGASDRLDVLVAADTLWVDRSGLPVPTSSPGNFASRGPSANDFMRAKSLIAKVTADHVLAGKVSLLASVQSLDARTEFSDFEPLTHHTREGWLNQNYRLLYSVSLGERVSASASVHYFTAAPSSTAFIDPAKGNVLLLRQVAADGAGAAAELKVDATDWLALTVGADVVDERHLKQTFAQVLTADVLSTGGTVIHPAGTVTPGVGAGETAELVNVGAFAQALATLNDSWSGTAGVRVDQHSLYLTNPSARVGLVYAPPSRPLSLKLLAGTSFKAPSAEQLYTQPMGVHDVIGNPQLKPQTARTVELNALAGLPSGLGEVSVTAFAMSVVDLVEFQQRGLYRQATNLVNDVVAGLELESRLRLTDALRVRVSGGLARTVAQSTSGVTGGEAVNPLFPMVQVHAIGEYRLPQVPGLMATLELSWIGPRAASQSNSLIAGGSYDLPAYVFSAASISWTGTPVQGRPTTIALRGTNLFAVAAAEPGFGGIDVPVRGPGAMLTVTQGL